MKQADININFLNIKNSNIINSQITKTNDYKGVRQSAIYAIVEVINIIDILYSNMSV